MCLLTFDTLLSTDTTIKDHWLLYRRSIKTIVLNSTKFNVPRDQIRSLEKHLANIENCLLSGTIFKVFMYNIFNFYLCTLF